MLIERKQYIDKLLNKSWNGKVKIITGIRRCGKWRMNMATTHMGQATGT